MRIIHHPLATVFGVGVGLLIACGDKPGADDSQGTSPDATTTAPDESTSEPLPTSTTSVPTTEPFTTGPEESTTSGTTTTGDATTTTGATTTTETGDATTTGDETTTGDDTSSTGMTTQPNTCEDMAPALPQDSPCQDVSGCECASEHCFVIPILGGLCGECNVDNDCPDGGCSLPNPIGNTGSVCNLGEPGAGCGTDAVCVSPGNDHCGSVLNVPGIINIKTCGACVTNSDCTPGSPNCTPNYDILEFTGINNCAANGSQPNNHGCNPQDDGMGQPLGNSACASGFCGEANVMGLLQLGVCGECNSNNDCPQGQACTQPQADLETGILTGSVCN